MKLLENIQNQEGVDREGVPPLVFCSSEIILTKALSGSPLGMKQADTAVRGLGVIRKQPAIQQRPLIDPINPPARAFRQPDPFHGVSQDGVAAMGLGIQQVVGIDPLNKPAPGC